MARTWQAAAACPSFVDSETTPTRIHRNAQVTIRDQVNSGEKQEQNKTIKHNSVAWPKNLRAYAFKLVFAELLGKAL